MSIDLTGIPIVSIVVFLPLLGALVVAFVPRRFEGAIKAIALGTALLAWVASLLLLAAYSTAPGDFQFL
jgi:NADH-quinone oxidoreductase subunit M